MKQQQGIFRILEKIRKRLSKFQYRQNYYLSKLLPPKVPLKPLQYIPDGFKVTKVANTGLRVIDNFCTADEANYLIEKARKNIVRSGVIINDKVVEHNGRTSSHSVVFHRFHRDPQILPIVIRGAMLVGVPLDNVEQMYVTRYAHGEYYRNHFDFGNDFLLSDRLCTVLIYLNTLEESEGGATFFPDLNIAVGPKLGRAVCWTNINPDGSQHRETLHSALPVEGEQAEKWVIQMWFRPYQLAKVDHDLKPPQIKPGIPLQAGDEVPDGAWIAN